MFERKPPKSTEINLLGIPIQVTRKEVKNINLRVYPSKQEVKVSAPWHLSAEVIRDFLESKRNWIQKKLSNYKAPIPSNDPQFTTGEVHLFQGRKMKLKVQMHEAPPQVRLKDDRSTLEMNVRPGSDRSKRASVLKEWYRAGLKKEIPKLIQKWEAQMHVSVCEFGVKQMKTRWGSCNIRDKRIWLNLELAKKSPACLEYVVVHEMVHLLERLHNDRFYRFMDQFLPQWQAIEKELQGKVD